MRTVFTILILFQAFALYASEGNGFIFGTVVESVTGQAISGATVRLLVVNEACPHNEILTDEKGQFLFDRLEMGHYRVAVTKNGFVRETYGEGFEHPAGQEFVITNMTQQYELEFRLGPAASGSGHVYDSEGGAVKDSPVIFQSIVNNRSYRTLTDDLGFFYVGDLPPDFYRVSARKYDAAKKQMAGEKWYYPGTLDESQVEVVEMQMNKTRVVDIRFGTPPPASWTGKVIGPEGESIANVDFGFLHSENSKWKPLAACRTMEDGTCSVRNLPAGHYWVYLTHIPAPYTSTVTNDRQRDLLEAFAKELVITDDGQANTLFQIQKGVRVEAKVYDAHGAPVAIETGITATLTHFRHLSSLKVPFHAGVSHPSTDKFEFYVHPELQYELTVNQQNPHSNYSVAKIEWNRGALTSPIRLPENSDGQLEIWVEEGSTISGIAPGAKIVFAEKFGGEAGQANFYSSSLFNAIVQDGNFLLKALPPGTYRLRANRKQGPFLEVTVASGESKTVTFQ